MRHPQDPTPKKTTNVKIMYAINAFVIAVFVIGVLYKLIEYLNK